MDGDTLDVDDVVKDEASNALSCRLIRIIMAAVIMSGEVEKLMLFRCCLLVGGALFCENYEMNGQCILLVVMLLFVVRAL